MMDERDPGLDSILTSPARHAWQFIFEKLWEIFSCPLTLQHAEQEVIERERKGAPITLTASEGTLSPAVEVEPGVFEAHWRLEAGQVGQAHVTARRRDRPASVVTAALERVPGPPRSIAIEVDKDQLVAGEGDELAVTARVFDVAGNTTE